MLAVANFVHFDVPTIICYKNICLKLIPEYMDLVLNVPLVDALAHLFIHLGNLPEPRPINSHFLRVTQFVYITLRSHVLNNL